MACARLGLADEAAEALQEASVLNTRHKEVWDALSTDPSLESEFVNMWKVEQNVQKRLAQKAAKADDFAAKVAVAASSLPACVCLCLCLRR